MTLIASSPCYCAAFVYGEQQCLVLRHLTHVTQPIFLLSCLPISYISFQIKIQFIKFSLTSCLLCLPPFYLCLSFPVEYNVELKLFQVIFIYGQRLLLLSLLMVLHFGGMHKFFMHDQLVWVTQSHFTMIFNCMPAITEVQKKMATSTPCH